MAYTKRFNPDALPAHAQPDEAAQVLSQLQIDQRPGGNITRPPRDPSNSKPQSSHHPPPPPPPPTASNRPQHTQNVLSQHSQHGHTYNQHNRPPQKQPGGIASPVPSVGHNWGSRPNGTHLASQQTALQNQYPPRTPAPPDPDSGELYPIFRAANASGSGSLSSSELGSALVNADFTPFDPQTTVSLVRMFSSSSPGQPGGPTITFPEFQNLWRFLAAWRELFERFDEDHSGRISLDEFSNALVAFGYRLSMPFVGVLYNTYGGRATDRRPSHGHNSGMSFDLFVQACISLKRMTDVFKGYDEDRDGYVTLSFEEFLTEILRLKD